MKDPETLHNCGTSN